MQNEIVSREKVFNIRFSAEEWARVEALANHHGVTAAALFRVLLKKEERFIAQTSRASESGRWEFIKREALGMAEESLLPGLRVSFDEDARAIIISDDRATKVVTAGGGVWGAIAEWPGSRLTEVQKAIATEFPLAANRAVPADEYEAKFGAARARVLDRLRASTPRKSAKKGKR